MLLGRSGLGGRLRCSFGCRWCCCFTSQNLKHHGAAGGAFAFDGFAPVLHRLLDRIYDFFLRLAFDAVAFGHKSIAARHFMRHGSYGNTLLGWLPHRQHVKG